MGELIREIKDLIIIQAWSTMKSNPSRKDTVTASNEEKIYWKKIKPSAHYWEIPYGFLYLSGNQVIELDDSTHKRQVD